MSVGTPHSRKRPAESARASTTRSARTTPAFSTVIADQDATARAPAAGVAAPPESGRATRPLGATTLPTITPDFTARTPGQSAA
jgi:hypothetical protein